VWRLTSIERSAAPPRTVKRFVTIAGYAIHTLPDGRVLHFMPGIEIEREGNMVYGMSFHAKELWRQYMGLTLASNPEDVKNTAKRLQWYNILKQSLAVAWEKAQRLDESQAVSLIF
jgi:hypothetical protein